MGTRRLQLGRVGAPRHRVCARQWSIARQLDSSRRDGDGLGGECLANWKDYRGKADEYRELDADRIRVLLSVGGRGKTGDLRVGEIQARGATRFNIHEDKVTRFVVYLDRALADPGSRSRGRGPWQFVEIEEGR